MAATITHIALFADHTSQIQVLCTYVAQAASGLRLNLSNYLASQLTTELPRGSADSFEQRRSAHAEQTRRHLVPRRIGPKEPTHLAQPGTV